MNRINPSVDQCKTPLPSELSTTDKSSSITISSLFNCEYNGFTDAVGSVRSTVPIPPTCKIYYYEIKVLNRGEYGKIGIGLTNEKSPLTNMPGWSKNTMGYHGDDGNFFFQVGLGRRYGPTFDIDDVVGCGILVDSMSVFFTINGRFLGIAESCLPNQIWYPTIGLHSENEEVEVNFGQKPFVYNISRHSSKTFKPYYSLDLLYIYQ